jgi:hypothetical protein
MRRALSPLLLLMFGACISCHEARSEPVIVHVIRDPSGQLAQQLRQASYKFELTKPRLSDRKAVMIATNEGDSFPKLLQQLPEAQPELLILNSEADLPGNTTVRNQLGKPEAVCGGRPAYIPAWASGEKARGR